MTITPTRAQLMRTEAPIEAWIDTLEERQQAAVLEFTREEPSTVLSYLYASLLGVPCSVDQWDAWVKIRCPKTDHRRILNDEITQLKVDLAEIRDKVPPRDQPTKIAYLSKELRGHIEHLSKEAQLTDRRSLLLAGVDVMLKHLKKVYGHDGQTWPAIEAIAEAAFAEIDQKGRS